MNTYEQEMLCSNCDATFTKKFDRGTMASGTHECTNCGCRTAKSIGMPKPRGLPYPDTIRFEVLDPAPGPVWRSTTGDVF